METTKPVRPLDAAKTLAHHLDWKVSNLKMQKVLYMAQMLYMASRSRGVRLIDANFHAWKYGPVIPEVYERLKHFKRDYIQESALEDCNIVEGEQGKFFRKVARTFSHLPALQLVRITHHPKGAWAKVYDPSDRDVIIPDEVIIEECIFLYRDRGLWEEESEQAA